MTQNKRPIQSDRMARGAGSRPAPQTRPAAGGARKRSRLPYDFWTLVLIGVIGILLAGAAQFIWPNGFPMDGSGKSVEASAVVSEIFSGGPIRINEIMSSNSGTIVDENGETADWIEVINVGAEPVNLEGYTLAKNENSTNVFRFPKHELQPGECALVFADSVLRTEGKYHAPFKLSSQGGSLMLFNNAGTAMDSVNFPAMSPDTSYTRQDQYNWSVSNHATPGLSNTEESFRALHQPRREIGVEITEVVTSNTQYAADENGIYQDYFEVHNTTGSPIDMSGWFVSDDIGRPTKWRLPEGVVLQPGEYKVIYASGMDRTVDGNIHAGFGLSSEGEAVVVADASGLVVDLTQFGLLKTDEAWMKGADGNWITGVPTPNAANF